MPAKAPRMVEGMPMSRARAAAISVCGVADRLALREIERDRRGGEFALVIYAERGVRLVVKPATPASGIMVSMRGRHRGARADAAGMPARRQANWSPGCARNRQATVEAAVPCSRWSRNWRRSRWLTCVPEGLAPDVET